MRPLSLIITIGLLVLLYAEPGSAEMTGEACHQQEATVKPMKMEGCCCSVGWQLTACRRESSDRFAGAGCCPPESCRKTSLPERVAMQGVFTVDYNVTAVLSAAMFQPDLTLRSATDRLKAPPPRAPASPIYLQYSSLLI